MCCGEATGERPSVDTRQPDLQLVLHLGEQEATVYVDSSGRVALQARLARRQGRCAAEGKRSPRRCSPPPAGAARRRRVARCTTRAAAPARSRSKPRRSPAAIAPGLKRRFAFERLLPFVSEAMRAELQRLRSHAQARIHASAVPIFAQRRVVPNGPTSRAATRSALASRRPSPSWRRCAGAARPHIAKPTCRAP